MLAVLLLTFLDNCKYLFYSRRVDYLHHIVGILIFFFREATIENDDG